MEGARPAICWHPMRILPLTLLLTACSDPPPPPAAPSTFQVDRTQFPASLQQCMAAQCPELATPQALTACLEQDCAERQPSWSVQPSLVRYDGEILSVQVNVDHRPAGFGDVAIPQTAPAWLGVTVLTEAGEDIDLAVQTVFPERLGEPFTFSAEVGPGVQDIIFGLWGKRIEPCNVARSGCQMFGFVLDESLAAWPLGTYIESPPRRQRITPDTLTLAVRTAGAPLAEADALLGPAQEALAAEVARFGSEVVVQPLALAAQPAAESSVRHAHSHDGPVASLLAAAVGPIGTVEPDPAAGADFVITLGGDAAHYACLQAGCADLRGDALRTCAAQACP